MQRHTGQVANTGCHRNESGTSKRGGCYFRAETSRRWELRLIKNLWIETVEGNTESKQNPSEM